MSKILCIESATTNCSIAVLVDGKVRALEEENTPQYSHSEQLHVFIEKALQKASLQFKDLEAVAVSKGPGSYTGLRIGVSAAKGLCFSLDVPLISIPTLESMAHQVQPKENDVIIPVLDARRMEVYSCIYDADFNEIRETKAEVITPESFSEYLGANQVHLIGNGAEKCQEMLSSISNFQFDFSVYPSAREMASLAQKKFEASQFENVAYFEPYYLKDFVLQKKKS